MTRPLASKIRLTGMPEKLVNTSYLTEGVDVAYAIMQTHTIGVFDGPPGVGKSTTKDWVASQFDIPVVSFTMPPKPNPLTALRTIVKALTGVQASGDKDSLENQARDHLTGWGGLLAVDEVQTIGHRGIAELRYLHDISRESFGMLLIGHGAEAAVQTDPALDSRILLRANFSYLYGEDLIRTLNELDPRLGNTHRSILGKLNDRHAAGTLREWAKVLLLLNIYWPSERSINAGMVTEILTLLRRMNNPALGVFAQDVA